MIRIRIRMKNKRATITPIIHQSSKALATTTPVALSVKDMIEQDETTLKLKIFLFGYRKS